MTSRAYDDLLDRYRRVSALADAVGVLNWDQQVTMPAGGTPARAQQLSAVSTAQHDHLVADETGRLLEGAEGEDLDDEERAVVREIRREYEREKAVPSELVEELSRVQSEAQETWQAAKADDDFEAFAPTLERLRELHVERAEAIDPDQSPYVTIYEDGAPYLPIGTVEDVFDELRGEIPNLVAAVREADPDPERPFAGSYDDETQLGLSRAVLEFLGYDFDRGRLDTAPHPFMSGNQFDARVTTRFKESDPLDALTATIHEFGHATYQLGLRQDAYGTPLGHPRSSGVHESQSRFWENHVGRTRAFWAAFGDVVDDHLGTDVGVDEAYAAVNRVYPDNLIRVEADELTYHMHIILRTEIDRAFVAGDLDVGEIPQVWNEKMDDYLGVVPDTDREGCLQDIHWSYGFAGFQSYTVGSVLAAQLDDAVRADLDVDGLVRDGEFAPIREWMGEQVHRRGCRYETPELIERASGSSLGADAFLSYVDGKFGSLYGL
jgi:carboxypeptidase Taq